MKQNPVKYQIILEYLIISIRNGTKKVSVIDRDLMEDHDQ